MSYPIPANEIDRLLALQRYNILDTEEESGFEDLSALAAQICETPIAVISLSDTHRQWFKSHYGVDATEVPREGAFCVHAICQPDQPFIIPNTLEDSRFADVPLVTSALAIRFYAGTSLVTSDGYALGTLCTLDRHPRKLTPEQLAALQALGRQVITQLELRRSLAHASQQNQDLQQAFSQIRHTQSQLIQSERLAGLGHLTAGIAHEVNNPVTFIQGNLNHLQEHTHALLRGVALYQQVPIPAALQAELETLDLDFIQTDMPKLVTSMEVGTQRIKHIVQSLRSFARLDESDRKPVDLSEGITQTLALLQHRLEGTATLPTIEVHYEPVDLPLVDCYPSPINQVFFSLINNAIDAVRDQWQNSTDKPKITILTQVLDSDVVSIGIIDNGIGIPPELHTKIFDPFFTTKPIGQGTGVGLSISHQIITAQHQGTLKVVSQIDQGTEFWLEIPIAFSRVS